MKWTEILLTFHLYLETLPRKCLQAKFSSTKDSIKWKSIMTLELQDLNDCNKFSKTLLKILQNWLNLYALLQVRLDFLLPRKGVIVLLLKTHHSLILWDVGSSRVLLITAQGNQIFLFSRKMRVEGKASEIVATLKRQTNQQTKNQSNSL